MPRIEIIPAGWENSKEKAAGEGTPTEDLCCSCVIGVDEGDSVQDVFPVSVYPDGTIGSTDIDHPAYEEEEYACSACGEKLTKRDN